MSLPGLRDEFPVLRAVAYLNAGTDGPLPTRAVAAAHTELERELATGRALAHHHRRSDLRAALRDAYAVLLGADAADVALTTSTTEGIAQVIGGLELTPADEILTSDEEHPGLLGALAAARELRGVSVRQVPLAQIADALGPRTRLVACSHVGWASGLYAPVELREVGVPVLLDGAQGVGAVPVDVRALGCDAYAGAGQKWLCGPDGTGMLWVSPALGERLTVTRRGYENLADPDAGIDSPVHDDARRLDTPSLSAEATACALAAFSVLDDAGWAAVHEHARALAARLVELLADAGRVIAPRADTTLVSFHSADPQGERERLAELGVVIRSIPNHPWLRASVGAWNDEEDFERLLAALDR